MKLRELAASLEGALERMQAIPEAGRPCVFVERGRDTGIFVQYYGGFGTPIRLMTCLNPSTSKIPGFEERAAAFFGAPVRIHASEDFGDWTKVCGSIAIAVELGLLVFRNVLGVDWGAELRIEEFAQTPAQAN